MFVCNVSGCCLNNPYLNSLFSHFDIDIKHRVPYEPWLERGNASIQGLQIHASPPGHPSTWGRLPQDLPGLEQPYPGASLRQGPGPGLHSPLILIPLGALHGSQINPALFVVDQDSSRLDEFTGRETFCL